MTNATSVSAESRAYNAYTAAIAHGQNGRDAVAEVYWRTDLTEEAKELLCEDPEGYKALLDEGLDVERYGEISRMLRGDDLDASVAAVRAWMDADLQGYEAGDWIEAGVWDPDQIQEGRTPKDIIGHSSTGPVYWSDPEPADPNEPSYRGKHYAAASENLPEGGCSDSYAVLMSVSAICADDYAEMIQGKYSDEDDDIDYGQPVHDERMPSRLYRNALDELNELAADAEEQGHDRASAVAKHLARRILADEWEGTELETVLAAHKIAYEATSEYDRWSDTVWAIHG